MWQVADDGGEEAQPQHQVVWTAVGVPSVGRRRFGQSVRVSKPHGGLHCEVGGGCQDRVQPRHRLCGARCVFACNFASHRRLQGIWNERSYSITYIETLRAALDAAGFSDTQIVAPDSNWGIAQDILDNSALAAAVWGIGLRCGC